MCSLLTDRSHFYTEETEPNFVDGGMRNVSSMALPLGEQRSLCLPETPQSPFDVFIVVLQKLVPRRGILGSLVSGGDGIRQSYASTSGS